MSTKLTPGVPAPSLSVPLLGGGVFDLSEQKPAALTMIVVYRGYHCPLCRNYIGKLNIMNGTFATMGAEVIAISMDGEDRAQKAKDDWALDALKIGYGLTEAQAREWGLWISSSIKPGEADIFAEPGTFWVLPDGTLYLIDIANMPFARPDLDLLAARVKAPGAGYPARGTHAG